MPQQYTPLIILALFQHEILQNCTVFTMKVFRAGRAVKEIKPSQNNNPGSISHQKGNKY